MSIFLGLAAAVSILLILIGYAMDRSGIEGGINGANGLPLIVLTVISIAWSFIVCIILAIMGAWGPFWTILISTGPVHIAVLRFFVWRLERQARRKIDQYTAFKKMVQDKTASFRNKK